MNLNVLENQVDESRARIEGLLQYEPTKLFDRYASPEFACKHFLSEQQSNELAKDPEEIIKKKICKRRKCLTLKQRAYTAKLLWHS